MFNFRGGSEIGGKFTLPLCRQLENCGVASIEFVSFSYFRTIGTFKLNRSRIKLTFVHRVDRCGLIFLICWFNRFLPLCAVLLARYILSHSRNSLSNFFLCFLNHLKVSCRSLCRFLLRVRRCLSIWIFQIV